MVPGDVKYKDQNGDKVIDDYDKVAIGYSTCFAGTVMYGFSTRLGYRM
ncbi:MAG: hypothetical protein ACLVEJ_14100 [Parabacteroides sp.]